MLNSNRLLKLLIPVALILIAIGIFVFQGESIEAKSSPSQLTLSPPTPDSLHVDTISGPQKIALSTYKSKNYELAKKLFNGLPASDEQRFYLAMTHWELGEESKAILLWMVQANQPEAKFHQDAQWYLAQAYVKKNQLDQAQELLNKIAQQADHSFNKEAKDLLEELE